MSLSLRHQIPLEFVLGSLSANTIAFGDFGKVATRAFKKYMKDKKAADQKCPNCESDIYFVEGCKTCKECGWGECG